MSISKIIGTFLTLVGIIGIFTFIILLLFNQYSFNTEIGSCYDEYHNKIIELTCETTDLEDGAWVHFLISLFAFLIGLNLSLWEK